MSDAHAAERILELLRPYAANWSGSLGRGDLVIPQRELPHLASEIVNAVSALLDDSNEVTDAELFHTLQELDRLPSLQDRVRKLRDAYTIAKR